MVNRLLVLSKASSASSSSLARLRRSADVPCSSSTAISAQRGAQPAAEQQQGALQPGPLAACSGLCSGPARASGPRSTCPSCSGACATCSSSSASPSSHSALLTASAAVQCSISHSSGSARAPGGAGAEGTSSVEAGTQAGVVRGLACAPDPAQGHVTQSPSTLVQSPILQPAQYMGTASASAVSSACARRLPNDSDLVSSRTRSASSRAPPPLPFPEAVYSGQSTHSQTSARPTGSQLIAISRSPCPVVCGYNPPQEPPSSERRARWARAMLAAAAAAAAIDAGPWRPRS